MNSVDTAVIVLLLVSGVIALMRGFVYEVLAMTGWVLAALAAFWGVPLLRPYMAPHISNATVADAVGGIAIFLVVLLISSFITHSISKQVKKSAVSAVDRSLGFAFGLVRGLVLASLCYIMVDSFFSPGEPPEILASAKTRPLLAAGARIIKGLIPGAKAPDVSNLESDIYNRLSSPKPKSQDDQSKDKQPAYDKSGLERLIENSNGKDQK